MTMKQLVITDNGAEMITVKWDGERFGLVQKKKSCPYPTTIILNPQEMDSLIKFAIKIELEKGGK